MNASAPDWIPGVGKERIRGAGWKSLSFALLVTLGLFCLIPLSEFIRRADEWLVREVEAVSFTPPPPPKTEMEKEVEKEALTEPVLPKLAETPPNSTPTSWPRRGRWPRRLQGRLLPSHLQPRPRRVRRPLVFALHELDKTPKSSREALILSSQPKRKGVEVKSSCSC